MREFTSGTRACHRSRILLACITTLFSCAVAIAQNPPEAIQPQLSQPLLYWAYPVNPPSDKNATSAEQAPRQVPGSSAAFSPEQVEDRFNPPDWHPDRHPALPTLSPTATSPTSSLAPSVIYQTVRVVPKTPAWPGFPPRISFSSSPISRAVCAKARNLSSCLGL